MSDAIEKVQQIYAGYFAALNTARADVKPTDGILGLGNSLGSNPCHSDFAARLEEYLKRLAASGPDADTAMEVVQYICQAPQEHTEDETACWMLIAVHRLAIPLLPFLTPLQLSELYHWYDAAYPRQMRLPAQNELVKQLRDRSGQRNAKPRFPWQKE